MSSNSRITTVQRRVLSYLLEKNYNSAIKLLTTLILKFPNNNILKLNRAIAYFEILYYGECIIDCKEILETDPFELKAIILYGKSLYKLNNNNEALKILYEGREIHADVTLHYELETLIAEINRITSNNNEEEKENRIGKASIKAPTLLKKVFILFIRRSIFRLQWRI